MTYSVTTSDEVLTIHTSTGLCLKYSPKTDSRVDDAIDGKILTANEEDAESLAAEMHAWGIRKARAFNCAVVFWG